MMLRIAFTFLCLTAAEPCSEFDPFCSAKGHELLQRQKLLKMETENLMSYEEFEASVKDSYATGQKRLKRSDFLVEKDFASFHHPAYRAFTKDESCMENVQKGIHHFGKTTGLADDLNSTELEALMARVMEEMEIFSKHDHIENITDPDVQSAQFMKDFVETLTHEKPLMTSRLMEQLVANSEGNYTFDFPDWLLNFSMLDLHDRTGREIENTSHGLLLMQTQSYTEKMKRRSLPATFDSRTAWPACGEVIGRIVFIYFSLTPRPMQSTPFLFNVYSPPVRVSYVFSTVFACFPWTPLSKSTSLLTQWTPFFFSLIPAGTCGSCWAFGSLSAVDSRLCIATDGVFSGPKAQLSRGFATSCSKPNGGDGCRGVMHCAQVISGGHIDIDI